MLISHSRPKGIAWALRAGATSLPFASSPSALTNGRPGAVTRFVWPVGAGNMLEIQASWSKPAAVGLFGLIGTTLPVGFMVGISYRIAGTSEFTAEPVQAYVIERPHGARVVWVPVTPHADGFDGARITLYNYFGIDGAAVAPGGAIDIGEIWFGETTEIEAQADWGVTFEDPTTATDSELSQPFSPRGTPRRALSITPATYEEGDPSFWSVPALEAGVMPIERLIAKTDRGQQCVVVPRFSSSIAPESLAILAHSACFGTLSRGGYKHIDGPHYSHDTMTLKEAPVPVSLA